MAFIRAEFMSECLKRIVPITVILPCDTTNFSGTGTNPAKPPYKTLYLLHGIYGSDMDWVTNTNVTRLARERQIAVIMPAAENRFYTDDEASGMRFGEYIGKELVEVTRRMFPLSEKREDTFIGGMSMGGYGALINGLRNPDTFGYIAAMSSAVVSTEFFAPGSPLPTPLDEKGYQRALFGDIDLNSSEKNPIILLERLAKEKTALPQIRLSAGEKDPLWTHTERMHRKLEELGLSHEYLIAEGMGHNFEFWREDIRRVLDWLPHGDIIPIMDSGDVFGQK